MVHGMYVLCCGRDDALWRERNCSVIVVGARTNGDSINLLHSAAPVKNVEVDIIPDFVILHRDIFALPVFIWCAQCIFRTSYAQYSFSWFRNILRALRFHYRCYYRKLLCSFEFTDFRNKYIYLLDHPQYNCPSCEWIFKVVNFSVTVISSSNFVSMTDESKR